MVRPNPCTAHRVRPEWQDAGAYVLGCPEGCDYAVGKTRHEAVAEWNDRHPAPAARADRWPWLLAAAIILAALIGRALRG